MSDEYVVPVVRPVSVSFEPEASQELGVVVIPFITTKLVGREKELDNVY